MENDAQGEIMQPSEPEDLAADIRRANPYLPAVWAGGPGKNPAARNMAYRIGRYIKEGREVPLHEMQWFEKYGQALIYRKHKTTITIEDEELLGGNTEGGISNKDIAMELLRMLIGIRKDHADRIDRLDKEHRDFINATQQRNDTQNMEFIKLFQKDKYETVNVIQKAYGEASTAANSNMKAFVPLVEALLSNSVKLQEHTGKLTADYHAKLMEVVKEVGKPGNLELLMMMVLGPMLPILIPAALQKLGVAVPDGFVNTITKTMQAVLSPTEK